MFQFPIRLVNQRELGPGAHTVGLKNHANSSADIENKRTVFGGEVNNTKEDNCWVTPSDQLSQPYFPAQEFETWLFTSFPT